VCEGGGVRARLGASKRRMLSLAERPSVAVVPAGTGAAAEGIVAGSRWSMEDKREYLEQRGLIARSSVSEMRERGVPAEEKPG
jgi:hypothetical protein